MFINKMKALTTALVVVGALGLGTRQLTYLAVAEGPAASAQGRTQETTDEVQQAAADLAAARTALLQAEANMASARNKVARAEAMYRSARQRSARTGENVEVSAEAHAITARFKYRIQVETGWTETKDGGSIDILEVWGTRPKIEVGGQYLVRGKYWMPSHEQGTLYFHETAAGWDNTGPELDLQCTTVIKGHGEFTLMHAMGGPGYFHLHLIGANQDQSATVANVYFGTGDNVWRTKP